MRGEFFISHFFCCAIVVLYAICNDWGNNHLLIYYGQKQQKGRAARP